MQGMNQLRFNAYDRGVQNNMALANMMDRNQQFGCQHWQHATSGHEPVQPSDGWSERFWHVRPDHWWTHHADSVFWWLFKQFKRIKQWLRRPSASTTV